MGKIFILLLICAVASCAKPPIKHEVKEKQMFTAEITDPELKTITDEFFKLSKRNNIEFTNKVSMGFSKIDRGSVIGTCTYQETFREIDFDSDYWSRATWLEKVALVYHEMAHCYCERDHDFDDGKMYPDNSFKAIIQSWLAKTPPMTPMRPPGYLDDGCPKSLMHPTIIDDQCMKDHYDHYVKEMFERCEPF